MGQRKELTSAMQDYIRAIYDLSREDRPVATTALARQLAVAPASVTGMIKRLATMGLVDHHRYAGVVLTASGERVALEVMRHHRLIERYLADAMGVSWDMVHDEAHRLEHVISPSLGDRIDDLLGHPDRDPHGSPIPPKKGPFVEPRLATLAEATAGQRLVIRAVLDEDAPRLRYLDQLGMRPDTEIEVVAVAPFGGPITVRVAGIEHAVGPQLAATVSVESVGDGAARAVAGKAGGSKTTRRRAVDKS
jgi:DtxR family transcriptional regulator, Mn-dependent transcriptional regulator